MAILIVKGVQFALASLYLGSLYARLNEFVGTIVRAIGRVYVMGHADSLFL